jgi:hypothetical protein
VKCPVGIPLIALLAIPACARNAVVHNDSCYISKAPAQELVKCGDAVITAEAVAASEHVQATGASATLKSYPVAQGESHPAWWVTWSDMQFQPDDAAGCPPESFYVMVDATDGRVLAHDVPSCAP